MALSRYRDPIGWPLLPVPVGGVLRYPTLAESVQQLVRVLLTTRPGEQLMSPGFGVGLQNFLDEGNTVSTRRRIQSAVLAGLQGGEKRITVDAVEVTPVTGAPAQVHIQIYYRVVRTNKPAMTGVTLNVS